MHMFKNKKEKWKKEYQIPDLDIFTNEHEKNTYAL